MPSLTYKNGEYGFEDVINPGSVNGTPDSVLNAGEDVNGNGDTSTTRRKTSWGSVSEWCSRVRCRTRR